MTGPSLSQLLGRAGASLPRRVHGIAAVLLPYTGRGAVDWRSFAAHLVRTVAAGLDPAVNMDTGFGDLLTPAERRRVLATTREVLGEGRRFYAAAFAETRSRVAADIAAAYRDAIGEILGFGGTPVIVQSAALHPLEPEAKAGVYRRAVDGFEGVLAFELAPVFAPHGEIWDDETFARLLDIPGLAGAKHSSLDRATEWRRLAARDARRPDWRVYTGNDLAIDMVLHGSDYLLGLATFAPEAFAARDAALAADDPAFLTLDDALQHLGNVGFRAPVPAYKHSAAVFLHVTGGLPSDHVHPRAPRRPPGEAEVLADCAHRLSAALGRSPTPQVHQRPNAP